MSPEQLSFFATPEPTASPKGQASVAVITPCPSYFKDYDLDINPPSTQSARGKGIEASNDNRCPCCDSPRWCFILNDGNAVIWGRTDVAPDGWQQTGTAKDGRPIYAKVGTRQGEQRYKGILPSPGSITLEAHQLADFPQWVEIGSDHQGAKEFQIEFFYPDLTGQPIGKVVRHQCKDNKHLRPWHWQPPYHPDQEEQGWWSDRRQCAVCYTDFWPAYEQVIPSKRHRAVGKQTGQAS